MGLAGTEGNAVIRRRSATTAIVVDLRDEPSTTDRPQAIGASPTAGHKWGLDRDRFQVSDRVLAAWFGVRMVSVDGELGVAPVTGRVCGGNSPTEGRSSGGWGF